MLSAVLRYVDRTIPTVLKAHSQWVLWKLEHDGTRWTKVPVCPMTLRKASSTDPDTWSDYTTVVMAAEKAEEHGIGFVFTREAGIVGIDLDKCRNAETGAIEPWAQEIVRSLNSYTEISPSGTGLHIYLRGTLPGRGRKKGKIEAYSTGRFFTLTGNHLPGTPLGVEERHTELLAFHAQHFGADSSTEQSAPENGARHSGMTDDEILVKCRTARNAAKFEALWGGDSTGFPSHSEADLGLLGILRFYTQDPQQLDRLFRRSGLMRDKWDERHGAQTYGEGSIQKALTHVTETYRPSDLNGHKGSTASVSGMSGPSSEEWPEIQPVTTALPPVESLPLEIVPRPFRDWVADVSNRMQCPPDYVAAAMLVMAGSIIGAGCGIRPKKHDDWTVVPNLWGGVVGRPSMLKTPAIGEAMKPLDALEYAAKRLYDAAQTGFEAEHEAYKARKESLLGEMRNVAKGKAKDGLSMDSLKNDLTHLAEPAPPVWRRYKTNDATIEKMAELQAQNPRGLLLFRDELIGLFATWDKEGHEADRAFYLESWNGIRSYTSDRIGRGTVYVENLCASLFGGIQPSKLSSYLHAAMRGHNNDGMVQRLQLLVYPDEPRTWTLIDTPIDAQAKQRAYKVVECLASIDFRQVGAYGDEGQRVPYYRFDDAGQAVFYEWLKELEAKLRQDKDEPVLLEHLGKYRSLMPALALLFHVLSLADGHPASQVSEESAKRATAWCDYLESHARRIYGLVTNVTEQAAARLAIKLREGALPAVFTVRDVYRKEWSLLNDRQVAENACDELISLGYLRERITPATFGQRGKTEYLINPKVRS